MSNDNDTGLFGSNHSDLGPAPADQSGFYGSDHSGNSEYDRYTGLFGTDHTPEPQAPNTGFYGTDHSPSALW